MSHTTPLYQARVACVPVLVNSELEVCLSGCSIQFAVLNADPERLEIIQVRIIIIAVAVAGYL